MTSVRAPMGETETIGFGPLDITFSEGVIRPRPWTTAQSEWAAEVLLDAPAGRVLELCSGAGHIGLLAVLGSGRDLVCVDRSAIACANAEFNAERAGLASQVEIRNAALDEAIGSEEEFPLVIADPPWVRHADITRFPEDPVTAIDGGDDGLVIARLCLRVIARALMPGGTAILQLGPEGQVEVLAAELPTYAEDLVHTDTRHYSRGALMRIDRVPSCRT